MKPRMEQKQLIANYGSQRRIKPQPHPYDTEKPKAAKPIFLIKPTRHKSPSPRDILRRVLKAQVHRNLRESLDLKPVMEHSATTMHSKTPKKKTKAEKLGSKHLSVKNMNRDLMLSPDRS